MCLECLLSSLERLAFLQKALVPSKCLRSLGKLWFLLKAFFFLTEKACVGNSYTYNVKTPLAFLSGSMQRRVYLYLPKVWVHSKRLEVLEAYRARMRFLAVMY